LRHPYFWTAGQQLAFLQDVSDRLEVEPRDPPSGILKQLERNSHKTVGVDWYRKFNRTVIENMSKYRKYDGGSIQDLLRAIRNKKHHYQDLPDDIKKELGTLPDGFLHYFTSRFPNLLLHVFYFVQNQPKLLQDPMFQQYFHG
jgi:serine/threonine-protein kinase/endoribonuclease IRE1